MDKALVEKWVAALRSGQYQQGQGFLRSADNKYCCLGVGYEVAGGKWYAETQAGFVPDYYITDSGDFGRLSDEYLDLFGFGSRLPQEHLIALNDNGESFAKIADMVEERLLGHESVTSGSSTESG
jgi:hypothetical protein